MLVTNRFGDQWLPLCSTEERTDRSDTEIIFGVNYPFNL